MYTNSSFVKISETRVYEYSILKLGLTLVINNNVHLILNVYFICQIRKVNSIYEQHSYVYFIFKEENKFEYDNTNICSMYIPICNLKNCQQRNIVADSLFILNWLQNQLYLNDYEINLWNSKINAYETWGWSISRSVF